MLPSAEGTLVTVEGVVYVVTTGVGAGAGRREGREWGENERALAVSVHFLDLQTRVAPPMWCHLSSNLNPNLNFNPNPNH